MVPIEENEEEDEEMDEVEEVGVPGSGVGAFLAPLKKMVKKTNLKKTLGKGVSSKVESRASVFAKAGMLSARHLSRLVEECSVPAKEKEEKEKVEQPLLRWFSELLDLRSW